MATFEEKFNELFGPQEGLTPIEPRELESQAQRRAISLGGDVAPQTAIDLTLPTPEPEPEYQGALGGLLKTGTAQVGEGLAGLGEYATRQLSVTAGTPVQYAFEDARDWLGQYKQSVYDRMSPEVLDLKGREFLTLDPDRTIWQGSPLQVGEAIGYKLIEQIPSLASTMIPGAVMMRAGMGAKGLTYLGASEAGLSVGYIQNEIADGIAEMSDEQLAAESPRFAQLLETTDAETARNQFTAEAQGFAPLIGGLMVGAVSAAAGRYLQPVLEGKGGTIGQRFARGAISEGAFQEGPQESLEQIVGNIAAAAYDGDREALEGAAEAYVQGAVVGGPLGGTVGALIGPGPDDLGDPADATPEGDVPEPPASFEEVFGTGGESPFIAPDEPYYDRTLQDTDDPGDSARARIAYVNKDSDIDPTPADVRAAIQANLRVDDLMDDMFEVQQQNDAESLRVAQGGAPTLTTQDEMFPTAAPTQGPGVMVPPEQAPPGTQGVLPMPLRERGRPMLPENLRGVRLPTELDTPSTEPQVDINAQLTALRNGERYGVLLAPGQPIRPHQLRGLEISENFDGRGSTLVTADSDIMAEALNAREAGIDMQLIVGQLTGAGRGKPAGGEYVVQQYDENGGVKRESLVASPQEGQQLAADWGGDVDVLPATAAIERRELATQDMFNQGRTAPNLNAQLEQVRRTFREGTGKLRVRLYDGEGITLDEDVFDTYDEAEAYAEMLVDRLPDYGTQGPFVEVTPEVTADEMVGPMPVDVPEGPIGGELPPREIARAEAAREAAAPTEGERATREAITENMEARIRRETEELAAEMRDKLGAPKITESIRLKARKEVRRRVQDATFEERTQTTSAAAGSRTRSEAAQNIVVDAARDLDRESKRAIGGFFPPDSYVFNNPKREAEYREAWSELVDTELRIEMAASPTMASPADRKKKSQLLKRLAGIRQIDKPKRRAQNKVETAVRVDKDTVRSLRRKGAEIKAKIDLTTDDPLAELPNYTDKQIDALKGAELEIAFEQAIREREGKVVNFDADKWRAKRFPAEKKKLIRRALNARGNREATASRVAGVDLVTPKSAKSGGIKTDSLTSVTQKVDESSKDKAARFARKRTIYRVIDNRIRDARRRVDEIEVGGEFGDRTQADLDAMTAKSYLSQLADVAQAMLDAKQDDNASLAFMERLSDALQTSTELTSSELTKLMDKQVKAMEDFAKRRSGTEGRTNPAFVSMARRTAIVMKRNKSIITEQNKLNRRAKQKKNTLYQEMIEPVLTKLNSTYMQGEAYVPTKEEMEGMKFALGLWSGNKPKGVRANFYTPVRQHLKRLGFEFDGDTLTWREVKVDGKIKVEYDSTPYATRKFNLDGTDLKASQVKELPGTAVEQTIKQFNAGRTPARQETTEGIAANSEANRHVRGVALMRRFRKRILKNPTINQAIDAERKFVADMKAMGMRQSGAFLTIRIPGFIDISYRLMEPDLGDRKTGRGGKITKAEAFSRTKKAIKEFYTKEKKSFAAVASPSARDLSRSLSESEMLFGQTSEEQDQFKRRQLNTRQALGEFWREENVREQRSAEQIEEDVGNFDFSDEFTDDDVVDSVGNDDTDVEDISGDDVLALVSSEVVEHSAAIKDAGSTVGDMLLDRNNPVASGQSVLAALVEQLPSNSVYGRIARKLYTLNMPDIRVEMDWGKNKLKPGRVAQYSHKRRTVQLSRSQLQKAREEGRAEEQTVHAVLHELVHAATSVSLANNPALAKSMKALQNRMRQHWQQNRKGQVPYGLRKQDPPTELVAEFFSNPLMQNFAKEVPIEQGRGVWIFKNAWARFKTMVKKAIGFEYVSDNAFDLIMEMETAIFRDANQRAENLNIKDMDLQVADVAGRFWDSLNKVTNIERRARDAAARAQGRGGLLDLVSIRQMQEMYQRFFETPDGNPMQDYFRAFFGRNAKNAELMRTPSSLSRRWTELRDKNPDAALELSRVGTEATLLYMDPSKPVTHDANKHLHKDQHAKFNELRGRWKELVKDEDASKLWDSVLKYYKESITDEVGLFGINALRGIVTSGDGAMSVAEFDRRWNKKNILDLDSKDALKDAFPDLSDEMASTVLGLMNVRQLRRGIYMPVMRYGDYAVYGKERGKEEYYQDNKEANKRASDLRASDPTATVNVYKKGNEWVVRKDTEIFSTFESMSEAEEGLAELRSDFPNADFGDGVGLKMNMDLDSAIASNKQLNTIIGQLAGNTAAQTAIKEYYLRSLSDKSFRKREAKRKSRLGANYDLQHRNFSNYAKSSAYYRAQLEFGSQMGDAMNRMRKWVKEGYRQGEGAPGLRNVSKMQLQRVYENLKKRDDFTASPQEVSKVQRNGVAMTQFYMLTSASYHLINSTQPWMVTAPTLAGRHGWGQTLTAMTRAQRLIKAPIFESIKGSGAGVKLLPWLKGADSAAERAFNVFDDLAESIKNNAGDRATEYLTMLDKLREQHVLEVSAETELRDVAEGTGFWGKTMDATRVMAHIVEVNNRVVSSIAAYDLEYNRVVANGGGVEAATEAATQYAIDIVAQTQFDYSTQNKPPLFAKWPLVFQFMQWSQHINAHLIRNIAGTMRGDPEARKILLGILGTHLAAGGVIGVALQPIKMAIGMALLAFGDDDEPYTMANALSGETFDRLTQEFFTDMAGPALGTAVSRGIPAALGADQSTRMSLGTLFFVDVRPETPESVAGSLALSFGGAFVNQMGTFYRGSQHMASGDYMKAMESFSPKLLRDLLRAGRFTNEGLVNSTGDTVIDASNLGFVDVALQAVGFTPTTVTKFYEGQGAIKGAEAYVKARRDSLLRKFRTSSNRSAVLQEVAEFNRAYPQEKITRSTLIRGLKSKTERESRYRNYGANIDAEKAALYSEYGDPFR